MEKEYLNLIKFANEKNYSEFKKEFNGIMLNKLDSFYEKRSEEILEEADEKSITDNNIAWRYTLSDEKGNEMAVMEFPRSIFPNQTKIEILLNKVKAASTLKIGGYTFNGKIKLKEKTSGV